MGSRTTARGFDWIIAPAAELRIGDVVRPINACGPIGEVKGLGVDERGRKTFVVEEFADRDPSLSLPYREVDPVQRATGWVPRVRRHGETTASEDLLEATGPRSIPGSENPDV